MGLCVCLSVCHISPMEHLFVLKTLSRTQRATKVRKFVGIFLKRLRSRVMPRNMSEKANNMLTRNAHAHVMPRAILSYSDAPASLAPRMDSRQSPRIESSKSPRIYACQSPRIDSSQSPRIDASHSPRINSSQSYP